MDSADVGRKATMNGTPDDRSTDTASTPTQSFHEGYQAKLGEAIRALTDAARLLRPRLRRTGEGTWVEDNDSPPEQMPPFSTKSLA